MNKNKVCVLILDGFGVDFKKEEAIVEEIYAQMPEYAKDLLEQKMNELDEKVDAKTALYPAIITSPYVREVASKKGFDTAYSLVKKLYKIREEWILSVKIHDDKESVQNPYDIYKEYIKNGIAYNYAPFVSMQKNYYEYRNVFPTFITKTSGVFAGYEEAEIEIQGNSDTGHQQIFNLCVANQVSKNILEKLNSDWFRGLIEGIIVDIKQGKRKNFILKTLLSGEFGDDGYVHSALIHLYRVLETAFSFADKHGVSKEKIQIEAVLDGRDSPKDSSINGKMINGIYRYDFVGKLVKFLEKYDALSSLSWVIGRKFMDRNYRGGLIKAEYDMLTENIGNRVSDISELRAKIREYHEKNLIDSEIPPIIVGNPEPLSKDSVFFDLIFRADRQEPMIATLLSLKWFVEKQAKEKGTLKEWEEFSWFKNLDGLKIITMASYHDAFSDKVISVEEVKPHEENILYLLNQKYGEQFKFLFVSESVKEKHVGLFSRGRRPEPIKGSEERIIIPSYSEKEGVFSDDEFYKVPYMRHLEISNTITTNVSQKDYKLIIANMPGPDMVGHLIKKWFKSACETVDSVAILSFKLIEFLRSKGFFVIVTSDHGNVEHFAPDHGTNPVLTTVIPPTGVDFSVNPELKDYACLYDVSHTVLEILGVHDEIMNMIRFDQKVVENKKYRLTGMPLTLIQ